MMIIVTVIIMNDDGWTHAPPCLLKSRTISNVILTKYSLKRLLKAEKLSSSELIHVRKQELKSKKISSSVPSWKRVL